MANENRVTHVGAYTEILPASAVRVTHLGAYAEILYSNVAPPTAPSGLTAVSAGTSQINLSWADNSSSETGFEVERSADGSTGWTNITTTAAGVTTFSDTGLTSNTTYYYRVRAINAGGGSAYTTTSNATTDAAVPATPTNLTATAISDTQINLTWDDNAGNENLYQVERSANGVSGWSNIAGLGANSTSYSNTGLTAETTYYYRVYAFSFTDGAGSPSNVANATTQAPAAPNAPTSLTATAVSSSQINLAWQDNSSNEDSFTVQQSDDGISWSTIATVAANTITYSVTELVEGTEYYFRVLAFGNGVDSDPSNEVNETTWVATPQNLQTVPLSTTEIQLTWEDVSAHETAFEIERSDDGVAGWTHLATPVANSINYTDTGITEGVVWYYRIKAVGPIHDSAWSAVVAGATNLETPTELTATAFDYQQIDLQWVDNSTTGSNTFTIERSLTGAGTWQVIAEDILGDTYSDSADLAPSTVYYYRVQSHVGELSSDYSNIATATTQDPPPSAPYNLRITGVSDTKIRLEWRHTWTAQDTSISGFSIERSEDNFTSWFEVATIDYGQPLIFTDTELDPETVYYYRVRSYRN